jgi:hypothetical protein
MTVTMAAVTRARNELPQLTAGCPNPATPSPGCYQWRAHCRAGARSTPGLSGMHDPTFHLLKTDCR